MRHRIAKLKAKLFSRKAVKPALIVVAILVFINVCLYGYYHGRTYPRTSVNKQAIGNLTSAELKNKLKHISLLPTQLQLVVNRKTMQLSPAELGIEPSTAQMATLTDINHSWFPLFSIFSRHQLPLVVQFNDTTFNATFSRLQTTFEQGPTDAAIIQDQGNFSLKPEINGLKLDSSAVKTAVANQLSQGKSRLVLPASVVQPKQVSANLTNELQSLQAQQQTAISFSYQSKSQKLTAKDIGSWFSGSGSHYVLSDDKIKDSISRIGSSFGIRVKNIDQAVAATKAALQNRKALAFTLEALPLSRKTYSYCVATRGVDASYLPGLQAKLAAVLTDVRGWSLNGEVSFVPASSNCSFTVWLSAANQMSSFGAICDSLWSCTVSPNVIINFDRWQGASSAWNAAGGSLEDYRVMVINHETGHWLGFGHRHCGGPGQAAPVMQQQSIDLEGCRFNQWPLADELASLRIRLGL